MNSIRRNGAYFRINKGHGRYREWPESGLSKFEDILNALRSHIEAADYFYFIDGDVRFQEDVLLADVAGDLVGVEHPFYVRGPHLVVRVLCVVGYTAHNRQQSVAPSHSPIDTAAPEHPGILQARGASRATGVLRVPLRPQSQVPNPNPRRVWPKFLQSGLRLHYAQPVTCI